MFRLERSDRSYRWSNPLHTEDRRALKCFLILICVFEGEVSGISTRLIKIVSIRSQFVDWLMDRTLTVVFNRLQFLVPASEMWRFLVFLCFFFFDTRFSCLILCFLKPSLWGNLMSISHIAPPSPRRMESSCLDLALEGERLCKAADYRAGVSFFESAIQVGTEDLQILSAIYSQLGNAYFHLQEYNKALEYHRHDLTLTR